VTRLLKMSAHVIALALMQLGAVALAAEEVTMADLEALVKSEDYDEAVARGRSISASKRGDTWKPLIVRAATGFVKQSLEKVTDRDSIHNAHSASIVESYYSFLLNDMTYLRTKKAAGQQAVERCAKASGPSACLSIWGQMNKGLDKVKD